jgi:hypothetical protein
MKDTALYPAGDGFYGADFGGISVQVDTSRREVKTFVSLDDAADEDFDSAGDALARIGALGLPAGNVTSDRGVIILTQPF